MKRSFALACILLCLPQLTFANQDSDLLQDCGNVQQAIALAALIIEDNEQQRSELRCNPLLSALALEKAQVMAERGMVMHNLNGSPNSHLTNGGYQLPGYYGGAMSNQVEAIAGGYTDATGVWQGFKRSQQHRQHLLGELPFYLEQDEIGVAFFRDSTTPHVEYWVVYVTKGYLPNQASPFSAEQIPNKSVFDPVLNATTSQQE